MTSDIETQMTIRFNELAREIVGSEGIYTLEIFRQIVRVLEGWDERYGPFSKQQEAYATKVLVWTLRESREHGVKIPAFQGKDWLLPYTAAALNTIADHETVATGMKKRCSRERSLAKLLTNIPE